MALLAVVSAARARGVGDPEITTACHAAVRRLLSAPGPSHDQATAGPSEAVATTSPSKKPIRVYFDGCFDIMHSGHFNALRQARELADELVVGVHSDAVIEQNKGPPVMNDDERLAIVRSCKWVDEVVFDTPYELTTAFLDSDPVRCDFCVHGDDLPVSASGKGSYDELQAAGRFKVIKRTEGVSTTDIVGRLLFMTQEATGQAAAPAAAASAGPSPGAASSSLRHDRSAELPAGAPVVGPPAKASPSVAPRSSFFALTRRIQQFSNGRVPSAEDTVVYIDGDFDLFHVGHVELLEMAKQLGTFLYVGVLDDADAAAAVDGKLDSAGKRSKPGNYPIMGLHERVLNVLSCKFVDEVIIGAPRCISSEMVSSLRLAKVCVSPLEADRSRFDGAATHVLCSVVELAPPAQNITTESVIARILANRERYIKRNAVRSKKQESYLETREYIQER